MSLEEGDKVEYWYQNSYKNYGELVMFDCGERIQQLEQYDPETVCVLSELADGSRNWISLFALPEKIVNRKHNHSHASDKITTSRDLRNLTGIIPDFPTTQILALYGKNKLLGSQLNTNGICMYSLNDLQTGKELILEQIIEVPLENPKICLMNSSRNEIILTKDTTEPTLVADLTTGQEVCGILTRQRKPGEYSTPHRLSPLAMGPQVVALNESYTGHTYLFDIRAKTAFCTFRVSDVENLNGPGYWTFASGYSSIISTMECSREEPKEIYFLNSKGAFSIYDLRNVYQPVLKTCIKMSTENECIRVKPSPYDSQCFSVSGFDSNVYLFHGWKWPLSAVFAHEGHGVCENTWSATTVMDHLWYTPEIVVSAALNGTVQCWEAKNFSNVNITTFPAPPPPTFHHHHNPERNDSSSDSSNVPSNCSCTTSWQCDHCWSLSESD